MTDWEARWAAGDTPWDKGHAAPPLEELLEWAGGRIDGMRVLVPGCGSGHDARALAVAGASVTGLDVAPSAVAAARQDGGGARFEVGDFMEWQDEPYDMVWEHTCFCAIDPARREAYAAAAARLVRPDGYLAGVFYLQPWDPGETPEPPPYATSCEEVDALLERDFERVWDKVPERSYPGREGREWLAVFRRRDRGVAEAGGER